MSLAGRVTRSFVTVNRLVPKCSVSDQFTAHISASHRCQNASPQRYGASSPTFQRGKYICSTPRGEAFAFPTVQTPRCEALTSQPTPSLHCGPPCCFHIRRTPEKQLNKDTSAFKQGVPHGAVDVSPLRLCKWIELCELRGIFFTHRVASSSRSR